MTDLTHLPGNAPTPRDLATRALQSGSPFKATCDAALGDFAASRALAVKAIRDGVLTTRVGRDSLGQSAAALKARLASEASTFSSTPRYFGEMIARAAATQAANRRNGGLEGAQRETNRLLNRVLIEQRITNQAGDYEAHARNADPHRAGDDGPSLQTLLSIHADARRGDDDAHAEWARRRLQTARRQTFEPQALEAIDRALESPDEVSDPAVARHLQSLEATDAEGRASFAKQATESRAASGLVATFLATQHVAASGTPESWTTDFLAGMPDVFPEAAVFSLAKGHAERRTAEREAAMAWAEHTAAQAERLAQLDNVQPPTEAELSFASLASKGPGADLTRQ